MEGARVVPDGTPILVNEAMRPVEPWCTFLRLYSQNLSSNSIVAYARDALEFAQLFQLGNEVPQVAVSHGVPVK